MRLPVKWIPVGLALVCPRAAGADPAPPVFQMPEVVVQDRPQLGDAAAVSPVSASEGTVAGDEVQDLPLLRRGELMESVPGMVVTQHSGDGKANQYFLRGFNLDHGTDFAFSVDGVPVNLPTHAHGQGYADLNFLIPELVAGIDFKKGPFYPEVGDFSGAGAADIRLVDRLPEGIATVQAGHFGYARALLADSPQVGPGRLLYAFEYGHTNGPWQLPEHANRYDGLLRYRWQRGPDAFTATATAYALPDWWSTDQIPRRALDAGLPRFGAIDTSDGGRTARIGLSVDWTRQTDAASTRVTAYGFLYRLNLFSNFTYFLDDPVNGDQFQQIDRRLVAGLNAARRWTTVWWGRRVENTAGIQLRNDDIPQSGLDHTAQRRVLQVRIDDGVEEAAAGAYLANQVQWTRWLRSHVGLRGDVLAVDVTSDTPANSGRASAGILSPKAGLVLGPWRNTEIYLDAGTGFHSNDARGVTITTDPITLAPQARVPLLARTKGVEVGLRAAAWPGLTTTVSFWALQSSSELTFEGDTGDTSPNGPTRRMGVEGAGVYRPTAWLALSADAALTRARYLADQIGADGQPGRFIANSIPFVFSAAAVVETEAGFFGGVRVRHFSTQPLVEGGAVRQPASTIVNALVGYRRGRWEATVEALNLLDAQADDIAYFYASRLAGEPAGGVNDVHLHPAEPLQVRGSLTAHF
ncbi:MAG: TonB-dependent receptor plug domain-containing protein [Pseudomonadota bacterium]